ncbi:hypothetical protein [Bacillus shivajii]
MGNATYSSANMFATLFHDLDFDTIIGEPIEFKRFILIRKI